MQRIVLVLLGMASLVASGVITERGHVALNTMGGLGLQTIQGIRGVFGDTGKTLTEQELLRQKFILDILQQIYTPLQQQDLLKLDDRNIITNENLYIRPLTQEMQMVLRLISTNQMLSKQGVCKANNDYHVQQAVGYYRLLVAAQDFDTFKRLVVYGRQNINTQMFVHCLVVAIGERDDTQMLIVPALYEITPQVYIKDRVIDQVQQLDTGVSSVRPQLMDVMGLGRRNFWLNSRFADQQQYQQYQQQQQQQQEGIFDILGKSQSWMPWGELHKQIALRKIISGNVVQQEDKQIDKLVISLPGNGLLAQDKTLKSYVAILIDEIIMHQDTTRKSNSNQYGTGETLVSGQRGQTNYGDIMGSILADNEYSQYGKTYGGQQRYNSLQRDSTADRPVYAGRYSYGNDLDVADELNQNIYGGVRRSMAEKYQQYGEELGMDRNTYASRRNTQEAQRGINTVNVNDANLLFVGRRRKNPNTVVNMGGNRYDEDDFISGGRRVSNERSNDEYENRKYYNNDDDDTFEDFRGTNNDRYTSAYRYGGVSRDIYNNDEDDLYSRRNSGPNSYDYINRYAQGQRVGVRQGVGSGRDDFLKVVTQGYAGQKQYLHDDQDYLQNSGYSGQNYGESLDKYLPTTNINDERLLHINRRRLNSILEERNGNNYERDVTDEYNKRYNAGYERDNRNYQRSQLEEESNGYVSYNGNQNRNNRGENHGHRYRRSIVNQNSEQTTNAINGKLVVYSLQQLVARLNMERIALGQPQLIEDSHSKTGRGIYTNKFLGSSAWNAVGVQVTNEIETIIQQIDYVLQQKINEISGSSSEQIVNELGLVLSGQIKGLGLNELLGNILQHTNQQQRAGQLSNLLENQAAQTLLAGIVKIVDEKLYQIYSRRQELSTSKVQGININNVEVDQLQTYLEAADIDLTNLLNNNNYIQQTIQGNSKVVVGRVPRLNHKAFNIKIDVTSTHPQQVVVRNILVPKVDGQDNIIPLMEKRQNAIVLDITTVELQQGHNSLKLNSRDITITSPETTPLTKIYKLVMQALNGDITLQQDDLTGQSTLLPHHLLLPRGRANGLPMQLITVITPMQDSSYSTGIMGSQRSTGLNTLLLDNLPLNYPLYCDINDLDKVLSMPNSMIKDVKIYHHDDIKSSVVY